MTRKSGASAPPAGVCAVQDRFERWRKSKLARDRIPERLWLAAVRLCARHGIEPVRRWLRLNYAALRDRVARARSSGPVPQKKRSAPGFLEWVSTAPVAAAAPEYVLEVGDMRLRVRGAGLADVAELAARLLRGDGRS